MWTPSIEGIHSQMDVGEKELELIAEARMGNREAFEWLACRYRAAMRAVAGTVLKGELVEDAVQDGFITAFRSLKQLQDPTKFGPWLAAIVRNRARRLSREGINTHLSIHEMDRQLQAAPEAGAVAMSNIIQEAIERLPTLMAQCIRLYYGEQYSVGQIATYLELPATTVKWNLHAGRAALRQKLGPAFENEKW